LPISCACDKVFQSFSWRSLNEVNPEELQGSGVYAIRVQSRGLPVEEAIDNVKKLLSKFNWLKFEEYALAKISKLRKLSDCPILYIGAAYSLKQKYSLLYRARHPIFPALASLLISGWRFEIGWLFSPNPSVTESLIKRQYFEIHGEFPVLV